MLPLVDPEDIALLQSRAWKPKWQKLYFKARVGGRPAYLQPAHRARWKGQIVDHINGDLLDCRRSNLRIYATGRKVIPTDARGESRSPFKGITKTSSGRWLAQIMKEKVYHRIGLFDTPEPQRKRDLAAIALHGEFARTNGFCDDGTYLAVKLLKNYSTVGVFAKRRNGVACAAMSPQASQASDPRAGGRCARRNAQAGILPPPGSAKSTHGGVLFPPWLMQSMAGNVLAASHTTELAEKWGRRVRNLVTEHSLVLGIQVAADNQAAGRWALTTGSEYYAAGVGTGIGGFVRSWGLSTTRSDRVRTRIPS